MADVMLDETRRKLTCQGWRVDSIRHASPTAGPVRGSAGELPQVWCGWFESLPPNESAAAKQSPPEALSRTIVADCCKLGVDVGIRGFEQGKKLAAMAMQPGRKDAVHPLTDITGLHPAAARRHLVVTANGRLGLAPAQVRPSDVVVVLRGGQRPFVLRAVGAHYVLIGEAYVDGVVDGEAVGEHGEVDEGFEIW
jgi:hypothetical protein